MCVVVLAAAAADRHTCANEHLFSGIYCLNILLIYHPVPVQSLTHTIVQCTQRTIVSFPVSFVSSYHKIETYNAGIIRG